jgi:integrase
MDPAQRRKPQARTRWYSAKAVQYLNEDELSALFGSIDSPRDLAIFELAFHRGLRAGEVGLLQLRHLRLSANRIHIERLKRGNSGEYPLTSRESLALREWLAVRGVADGPLFTSRNHKAISTRRLDELMKTYGDRAGIPRSKRHFHCLRHTAGTLLSERADLVDVADHLGHRDIRSTQRYVRVRNRRRTELGERLKDAW